jgi:hypothetical protein
LSTSNPAEASSGGQSTSAAQDISDFAILLFQAKESLTQDEGNHYRA